MLRLLWHGDVLNEVIALEEDPPPTTRRSTLPPTLSLGIIDVGLHDLLKWGRGFPLHEFPIGKGIARSLQFNIDHFLQL